MDIVIGAIAAWLGLSTVAAIGWAWFHRAVGPTPRIDVEERRRRVA